MNDLRKERNGMDWNRVEQNGMERNGMECCYSVPAQYLSPTSCFPCYSCYLMHAKCLCCAEGIFPRQGLVAADTMHAVNAILTALLASAHAGCSQFPRCTQDMVRPGPAASDSELHGAKDQEF